MISIYGPPGCGKSTIARLISDYLEKPLYDLDEIIQNRAGCTIPDIFALEGETGFRNHESLALSYVLSQPEGIIALGGGALLLPENKRAVEKAGPILLITASLETLHNRLSQTSDQRPLLYDAGHKNQPNKNPAGNHNDHVKNKLESLLIQREEHYQSFPLKISTDNLEAEQIAWEILITLGILHVKGIGDNGYDVLVHEGAVQTLGKALHARNLHGPIAIVCDETVAQYHLGKTRNILENSGYSFYPVIIPAGEIQKSTQTALQLWESFTQYGLERGSTVLALGGGVISDLAGFAASTYLRGISWVVIPTTLLGMVDASVGGKTGINLQYGKNLVGSFYPPKLVLADTKLLTTLPIAELRSGMAEVIKAGIIGDPRLFILCEEASIKFKESIFPLVSRAIVVKIKVIQADPFEKGLRAVLNLGHTIGHAVEKLSGFTMKHGEAVAIGIVAEAELSMLLGLADKSFVARIKEVLSTWDLPTKIPGYMRVQNILQAMKVDKKRQGGEVRFTLPIEIGNVKHGVMVEMEQVRRYLSSIGVAE